jgi:hypothetical protein
MHRRQCSQSSASKKHGSPQCRSGMGSRTRAFYYLHSPGASAATRGDRRAQRILQDAAFERVIDPSLGHGGGEIRREDGAVGTAVVGAGQAVAGDLDDRGDGAWAAALPDRERGWWSADRAGARPGSAMRRGAGSYHPLSLVADRGAGVRKAPVGDRDGRPVIARGVQVNCTMRKVSSLCTWLLGRGVSSS